MRPIALVISLACLLFLLCCAPLAPYKQPQPKWWEMDAADLRELERYIVNLEAMIAENTKRLRLLQLQAQDKWLQGFWKEFGGDQYPKDMPNP